uniref:Uncharacterized protein n=1 Tax=Rhizophora mucronata TaxID=61149 RepID=A0A2P2Q1E5_RHIMU
MISVALEIAADRETWTS